MQTLRPILASLFVLASLFSLPGCGASGSTCLGSGLTPSGNACVSTADCCYQYNAADPTTELVCSSISRTCQAASSLSLGEPCDADVQCVSRSCDVNYHYCTTSCTADTDCASGTACTQDPYVVVPTAGWECRPVCTTDNDCAVYGSSGSGGERMPMAGSAQTCRAKTTLGSASVKVCSPA